MRRLFIVGAKILGLACIFWVITIASMILYAMGMLLSSARNESFWSLQVLLYSICIIAYMALSVWFSIVLLFKTDWLADKLKLEKDGPLPHWPELNTLLNLGIILAGLCILAVAMPSLGRSLISFISQLIWIHRVNVSSSYVIFQYLVFFIADIFKVAIGLIFVLMPGRLISFTERLQKKFDHKPAQAQK
jgi:hypothetical protein